MSETVVQAIADGTPWAVAFAFATLQAFFITRPAIQQRREITALWRECETDKKILREEHAAMQTEITTLSVRLEAIENGGTK